MDQEIKIIRQRRKTIGVYVRSDCTVEVRCPVWMSEAEALAFAHMKKDWIEKHIRKKQQEQQRQKNTLIGWGSTALYMGRDYPIYPCAQDAYLDLNTGAFYISSESEIKETLSRIYRREAERVLPEKIQSFSQRMGAKPAKLGISSARTCWGSCSGKGSIHFSWRLMMAPEPAIDYVVIHELAHLFHHNHSPAFWEVVRWFCPEYQERKRQLRETTEKMMCQGW